jgi:hypothetical protein
MAGKCRLLADFVAKVGMAANVRFWHKADMPTVQIDFRFRG